jgi:hypothetical protein
MVNYQFKIEYMQFWKICEYFSRSMYVFCNFVADIKKNCPGFAHLTPQRIRIRFLDEDGDYINLTQEDSRNFDEMLQHCEFVEERNVRKIQLSISQLDSPVSNVQPTNKKGNVIIPKERT